MKIPKLRGGGNFWVILIFGQGLPPIRAVPIKKGSHPLCDAPGKDIYSCDHRSRCIWRQWRALWLCPEIERADSSLSATHYFTSSGILKLRAKYFWASHNSDNNSFSTSSTKIWSKCHCGVHVMTYDYDSFRSDLRKKMHQLGTGTATKSDEFSEQFQRGGGGFIFNPKINNTYFGNFKQGFLSIRLVQKGSGKNPILCWKWTGGSKSVYA